MVIVSIDHVVGHIALIDINVTPLPALRLMAGDSIGELHLQSIEVSIAFHCPQSFWLGFKISIVFHHLIEELFALLPGEGGRVGQERVEHDFLQARVAQASVGFHRNGAQCGERVALWHSCHARGHE